MKKKDIVALQKYYSEQILKQKLTKRKKAEIDPYINIFDRSLLQKDPVKYLGLLLSAAQVAEIVKIIIDFLKPG